MTFAISRIGDDSYCDYTALLAMILRAFAYMDPLINPASSAHRLTAASLQQKAKDEIGFAVTEHDQLIACTFVRPEPPCLYIGKLAVDPRAQSRGLGKLLLQEAETLAREQGLNILRLETRIELTGNHQVFESWGFRKTAEGRHKGFDRATFIEMQKTLACLPG
ncbi:GNAT family N-acetyltransferase [Peteryoungia ipomoeae]|uniref:GNAT family N-acetyltransferase n=1 Tax=Peteryoungia ipomoeae TaxID=1210932 RepID=A0A4S8P7X9_9HYPH|nr:GNAT family N-acetyltransferase [Peteryoungia ipomoeae]THV24104.1 GNAT family N-acetyltransferase [Peteryoungia ipomoeae]